MGKSKNISKKEAISILVKAAKQYDAQLNNRHFMVVYQEGNLTKEVVLGFRAMNFLHLTGVKTSLSAKQFYFACLNGKLAERDVDLATNGKAQQKLAVLPYLSQLLYNNCMIGYFIDNGIYIRSDYFVGSTKVFLGVGFRYGKTTDFPVTLYNENVRKLVNPICKVLAIFSKKYNNDYFDTCTYLSKGQQVCKLKLDARVKASIDKNLLDMA